MSTSDLTRALKATIPQPLHQKASHLLTRMGLRKSWDQQYYETTSRLGAESPNPWIRKSASIGGWLFEGEHEALWELATRDVPGNVVEIGSWMGKSACILAGACVDKHPDTFVLCIDTFTMSGTEQQVKHHAELVTNPDGTFYDFLGAAKRHGYYDHVIPLGQYSHRALTVIRCPLRLAFIDGAHDYENVEREVGLCRDLISPGGSIALHDVYSGTYPELVSFVEDRMKKDPSLEYTGRANSIAIFRKRS